jgi:hypothetical protein
MHWPISARPACEVSYSINHLLRYFGCAARIKEAAIASMHAMTPEVAYSEVP